jgi:hypothetical protein
MSKEQKTPTRKRRLFNIDTEAKKFYPLSPVLASTNAGVPLYRRIMHKIPGTLRCIAVPSYRQVA